MNCLGLFARYPEPGHTKTRLAAAIGNEAAAEIYECFVRDLTRRCQRLCDRFILAVTPENTACRRWFESLSADCSTDSACELLFQPDGDLGERISWFFELQHRRGRTATVLIGTDSPDLPDEHIDHAFNVLRSSDVDLVVSPAADGGCVLFGMSVHPRHLFDNVRWSTPFTLLDTLEAASRVGLRCEVLESWYDVDTIDNLGTLAALQHQPGETRAARCPLTRKCLKQLLADIGINGERR